MDYCRNCGNLYNVVNLKKHERRCIQKHQGILEADVIDAILNTEPGYGIDTTPYQETDDTLDDTQRTEEDISNTDTSSVGSNDNKTTSESSKEYEPILFATLFPQPNDVECLPIPIYFYPYECNVNEDKRTVVIGRNSNLPNNTRISDQRISKIHCKFFVKEINVEKEMKQMQLYVIDEKSTNGTYVNGKIIEHGKEIPLEHGDQITIALNKHSSSAKSLPIYKVHSSFSEPSVGEKRKSENTTEEPLTKRQRISNENIATSSEDTRQDNHSSTSQTTNTTTLNNNADDTIVSNSEKIDTNSTNNDSPGNNLQNKNNIETNENNNNTENDKNDAEDSESDDGLSENLVCIICSEILYKPASVIPCMHTFCSGCVSQWIDVQDNCPQCRQDITHINKNHTIKNVVEAYLEKNPKSKRDEDDLKELDEQDKLKNRDSYCLHPDQSSSTSSTSHSSISVINPTTPYGFGGFGFGGTRTCRECTTPGPDGFQCPSSGPVHINCSACSSLMPLRSNPPRPQKCYFCGANYCDLYWAGQGGCLSPAGQNALKKFNEWNINTLPNDCLNSNPVEREILSNYLSDKSKTVNDAFQEICDGIDRNQFSTSNVPRMINVETNKECCERCATHVFSELLFQYRASISSDDLPSNVNSRPSCWWGKNCRTQKHNISHARRYNHICEQTRRS
eukprot:gb/GECH01011507.1/.p1 GENE.gb/GECH01011507.1/~~gb/GECH01011507.1/.p1  ORF type:complete len:679 (+),score=118.56 gb/GECH01011507.1/:1-2037(+)